MATVQALAFPSPCSQKSLRNPVYQLSLPIGRRSKASTRNSLFFCCLAVSHSDEDASPLIFPASHAGASSVRFAVTGGGSGGHVFPAIAIADELQNMCTGAKFLFIGTAEGMERDAVPSAGYDFASIPASRLSRPILSPNNLLFPFHLLRAIAAAWKILRRFRPQIVIGTGGYVAAPVYLAAALSGTCIVIQEQNAFPGLANKIASPFSTKVFLAFKACLKHFPVDKCSVCGNPVRLSLTRNVSKTPARTHFFPNSTKLGVDKAQLVLILGGSQGAGTINMAVLNMYYDMLAKHKNRYIIWQTGKDGLSEMESLVKNHRRLLLTPFLQAMDLAYAAADVVVSRAGAMTCTEILTTGKPCILIPSPFVAEDHQTNNALIMSDVAGSKILTEDELDSSSLAAMIDEVLGDEMLMAEMSEKALRSALPNAAVDIAQGILSIVNTSLPK